MFPLSTPFSSAFKAEARANLTLALPLIAAQLAGVGMGTVDTIMAGRLSKEALAAVSAGANLNVVFFVFFMGLLMACSPIVAHRAGAGHADARAGAFAREALLLSAVIGVIWVAGAHLIAAPVLLHIGLAPETAQVAAEFMRALSWSAFGFSAWFVLRSVAEGMGTTQPIFFSGITGLLGNLLLDWAFMYGKFGLPEMGAAGCGWATSISATAMALVLAAQYRFYAPLRQLEVFKPLWPSLGRDAREIVRLGFPIGLILLAEAGLFVLTAMWMARFGDSTMAAYQIALNFASVLFMIPLGIGLATTVRVGHAMGAGEKAVARYRGMVGMKLGVLNAASNASIMLLLSSLIVALYTDDMEIAAHAKSFLWLAAAFQLVDGLQVTANGALRGIKDTRVPMMITIAAYWLVGMPIAHQLGFSSTLGPSGLWWGLTSGLAMAALGLSLRFMSKSARL